MCQEKLLKYNFNTEQYAKAKEITIDPLCNGITVRNGGNTLVIFQGDVLNPGESKSVGGNRKEILWGRVNISFQLPVIVPPVPLNLVFVTQKYYLPNKCDFEQ
jgi:hypothetical protein